MTSYDIFENMITAKNKNDTKMFEFYAIQFAGATKQNPYPSDSREEKIYKALNGDYINYSSGRVGNKKARINILERVNNLLEINSQNPFDEEEVEEETKEELLEDSRYVLLAMVRAHTAGDEVSFKQYTIHLMDISKENPFIEGTEEYNMFKEMSDNYNRKPANMRRVFVVSANLCEYINNVEIYPETINKVVNEEPETILGVLPDEEKDKKSWFKFLHPWRKEGEKE